MLLPALATLLLAAPATAAPPNIVLILTDDLAVADMDQLPELRERFTTQGTSFDRAFVSLSMCCPSRASSLRGQYAHNTGILRNGAPDGGYGTFHERGLESSTVATWLHDAGYRTGLFGKYLNGYPNKGDPLATPPGWDDWVVPSRGAATSSYDYTLNDNGTLVHHGDDPEDHVTDVLAAQAVEFIEASHAAHRPFFAYVATYAPHAPAVPPPRYAEAFAGTAAPRGGAVNEADVTDKPAWLQALALLDGPATRKLDATARRRLASMLGVRDLVDRLIDALGRTGELDRTYLVFSSDNGYHLGQHRMPEGKDTYFEEDIRVPLYVRGPGVLAGQSRAELVVNVDLAATFAEMAGLVPPPQNDGRSWVSLLRGETPAWRRGVLLEHWGAATGERQRGRGARRTEQSTLEKPDGADHSGASRHVKLRVPPFVGVRADRTTYVRYDGGGRDLYDLATDPHQLQDIAASASAALLASLDSWLDEMNHCKGAACRAAEERSPTGE
ncbi:MAG: multidrug transporter [Myxococcales bacterium]|nr:multidrug transporter [Myxococcales bacterium]